MNPGRSARSILGVLGALGARPRLWPVALSTGASLVSRQWWRTAPFLPLPNRQWLRFRMVTAYGGDGRGGLRAEDVVTFLEWRRTFPR